MRKKGLVAFGLAAVMTPLRGGKYSIFMASG